MTRLLILLAVAVLTGFGLAAYALHTVAADGWDDYEVEP